MILCIIIEVVVISHYLLWHDSRAVKGDRLKICCISFVGSNPTRVMVFFIFFIKKTFYSFLNIIYKLT